MAVMVKTVCLTSVFTAKLTVRFLRLNAKR